MSYELLAVIVLVILSFYLKLPLVKLSILIFVVIPAVLIIGTAVLPFVALGLIVMTLRGTGKSVFNNRQPKW